MTDILIFFGIEPPLGSYFIIAVSSLSALVIGFIVFLLLSVYKSGFGLLKRQTFLAFGLAIASFQFFAFYKTPLVTCLFFTLFLFLFFYAILMLVKNVEVVNQKKTQTELARYFDSLKKSEETPENDSQSKIKPFFDRKAEKLETVQGFSEKEPVKHTDGIDFSHVKSIIKRIPSYSLTQSDKKQVKELSGLIEKAESGSVDRETKEKLNEGLGGLLKIMSKYGI